MENAFRNANATAEATHGTPWRSSKSPVRCISRACACHGSWQTEMPRCLDEFGRRRRHGQPGKLMKPPQSKPFRSEFQGHDFFRMRPAKSKMPLSLLIRLLCTPSRPRQELVVVPGLLVRPLRLQRDHSSLAPVRHDGHQVLAHLGSNLGAPNTALPRAPWSS